MNNKQYIVVIYEGEKREPMVFNNIKKLFFDEKEAIVPIGLPAGQNIYMLWQQLKEDDFQTDVIELLREKKEVSKRLTGIKRTNVAQIYLLFDYDGHTNNLKNGKDINTVLQEMLEIFNDETDLGKLYINYPMIESLRDHRPCEEERCFRRCCIKLDESIKYKYMTNDDPRQTFQDIRKYNHETWRCFCINTLKKYNCIVNDMYKIPTRHDYMNESSQTVLLDKQIKKYIDFGNVAIISSVPMFLLEYFKEEFWNRMVTE